MRDNDAGSTVLRQGKYHDGRRDSIELLLWLAALAIPGTLFAHSLLIAKADWDIEAFLYLGSRLNAGELLYLRDFETKLPLVQYLFALADRLGGVGAWRIIAFATVCLLAAIAAPLVVSGITGPLGGDRARKRKLSILAFLVFMSLVYSQPGSSSAQLSLPAAALMFLAIAIWSRLPAGPAGTGQAAVSGALVALAVLVRPNYAFAFPALMLFALRPLLSGGSCPSLRGSAHAVLAYALAAGLTILLSLAPYAFADRGIPTLADSLSELSRFSIRQTGALELLVAQITGRQAPFYLYLYTAIILVGATLLWQQRRHRTDRLDGLLAITVCIFSVAGLHYSFVTSHYWPHYALMFVPFVTILFMQALVIALVNRDAAGASWFRHFTLVPLLAATALLATTPADRFRTSLSDLIVRPERVDLAINRRNVDDALLAMLDAARKANYSFYVPGNANYHRLLDHERIGDGHPSILNHVLAGNRVGPIGDLRLYSEAIHARPCLAILESGKDLIVLANDRRSVHRRLFRCFADDPGDYVPLRPGDKVAGIEIDGRLGAYRIFARRPRSTR